MFIPTEKDLRKQLSRLAVELDRTIKCAKFVGHPTTTELVTMQKTLEVLRVTTAQKIVDNLPNPLTK